MKLLVAAAAATIAFAAPAMAQTAPAQSDQDMTTTPKGGYQPTEPLFSGPVTSDTTVVFVPSAKSPSEAFPPPAPKESYPICKPGQTDGCLQRSSARVPRR